MLEHQRNILAQMGVDLWTTRSASVRECSTNMIWRDQVFDLPKEIIHLKSSVESVESVESVKLQAYISDQVILLTEIKKYTKEEIQLLDSIKQAIFTDTVQLQWPCLLQNFQDYENLEYYVKGFLAVYASARKVITLGTLSHINGITSNEILPSVTELIQNPKLKKKVWEVINQSKE